MDVVEEVVVLHNESVSLLPSAGDQHVLTLFATPLKLWTVDSWSVGDGTLIADCELQQTAAA